MDDLISRQAAIDAMAELQWRASSKGELKGISKAWKRIKELPPIQPKRGKWIDASICGELPVIVCDQCNTFFPISFGDFHNFCPNCGAKMEVNHESN